MAFNPLIAPLRATTPALKLKELQWRFPDKKLMLTIWEKDTVCKKGAVRYMYIKADPYNPYYNNYISFECDDVATVFEEFCEKGQTWTLTVMLEEEVSVKHLI